MKTTLYKRNNRNEIINWTIITTDKGFTILHGVLNKFTRTESFSIPDITKLNQEYNSRINAKRKEGYKSIEELWDNAPKDLSLNDLFNYLNTYLPKYNTSSTGCILPMLAKTLEDNKPFIKHGVMPGQYKINGVRCLVGAVKNIGDLFNPIKLTYHSRTGTEWDLSFMDEIILPKLNSTIIEAMVEENAYLDGEIYLPGYQVNDINSFTKNVELPQHYMLQYWIYDICIENITAYSRKVLLEHNLFDLLRRFKNKDEHLNNKQKVILLPDHAVCSYSDAIVKRDEFIDYGFEGLIIRDPNSEYAFGKRINTMWKFKKKLDGKFIIVAINKDKRGLPIFVCKNDINDSTFECTLNDTQDRQLYFADLVKLNETCMWVEYRERSGVKEVPFHAKGIFICI